MYSPTHPDFVPSTGRYIPHLNTRPNPEPEVFEVVANPVDIDDPLLLPNTTNASYSSFIAAGP
jgi:hypothetical protein